MKKTALNLLLLSSFIVISGCQSSEKIVISTWENTEKNIINDSQINQETLEDLTTNPNTATELNDEQIKAAQETLEIEQENLAKSNPWDYDNYSAENLKKAQSENKKILLFFHASRCPTCQSLEKDILSKKSLIPSDTIIMKIDYDKETNLKKQYWVTMQNTIISIDSNWKETWRKSTWITQLNEIISMVK